MQKIKEKLILISIILLIFLLSLNSIYAKEVSSENMRYTDDNVKHIENTLSDSSKHIVEIDKDTENILCSNYSSKSDKLKNKADNAKFKSSKKSSQIGDLNKESKSSKENSQLDELDDEDYIYHINSTNLNTYFSNGVLKDDFKDSLLVFDGEFVDKGIFTISSPNVQILGNNSLFNNTVFCLNSTNILLSSLNFVLDKEFRDNDDAGILILGDNNTVYNCTMNYTVPTDCNGICVYAKGDISNKMNGFNLIKNTFNFNGNNLDQGWDYGIFLEYVDNTIVYANRINASLPLRTVDWMQMFDGVRIDSVAGFVADTCENLTLLNNQIITNVTSCGDNIIYPTLNTVMIYACNNSVIEKNFIYSADFYSKNGKDNYLQGIDLYFSNNVTIINNQIHIRTTGGCENAGTAYPIEITGPAQVHIAYNNLTSVNNGPNIGIYSHDFYGETIIEIISNFISITGVSSNNDKTGLVTGIEVQDSDDLIWNNTIIVNNLGDFDADNNIYGISYSQGITGNHSYNIQYNNITTNGNNTVALSKNEELKDESSVINSIIANNILNGYSSSGDESVYIGKYIDEKYNNSIRDNTYDEFINTLSFDDLPDWLKNHKTMIPIIPQIIIPKHTNENSNGSGTTENTGNGTTIVPKPNPENGNGINNNTNSTIPSNNTEINGSKINENIDPKNTETINKTNNNTIPSNNTPTNNELNNTPTNNELNNTPTNNELNNTPTNNEVNNATSNEIPQQNSNITNNKDTPKRPDNTNNELNEDTSNTHEISDKPGNNKITNPKNQNNNNSNNKNQNHASSISLKIHGKSISKQKTASPKEGGSSAANNKAYELKEKTKKTIQDNNHIAAILMSLIIILLVFAGYKRKNKQEE